MQKLKKDIMESLHTPICGKKRFQTVGDMEYLSKKGIRPVLHNGQVAGWEVQRG